MLRAAIEALRLLVEIDIFQPQRRARKTGDRDVELSCYHIAQQFMRRPRDDRKRHFRCLVRHPGKDAVETGRRVGQRVVDEADGERAV
ncbi:hypothetical protein D9M70_541430 [compost metagenome]